MAERAHCDDSVQGSIPPSRRHLRGGGQPICPATLALPVNRPKKDRAVLSGVLPVFSAVAYMAPGRAQAGLDVKQL